MTGHIFEATDTLVDALGSFETLLFRNNETADELLISLFTHPKEIESATSSMDTTIFYIKRNECLSLLTNLLRFLDELLPSVMNKVTIMELYLGRATLIFLHSFEFI